MKRFILAYTFFFSVFLSVLSVMSLGTMSMGCGSNSSGGSSNNDDITGLALPDQMALVTATDDSNSASINHMAYAPQAAIAPTSGDYVNDQASVYVYDESMKPLDMPNEILCSISQTANSDPSLLNAGNYRAMINNKLCSHDQGSGSNQSSSVDQSFEQWIVNSSRENNSADQIVKFWINETGGDNDGFDEIRAQTNIKGAPTSDHPFGLFSLNATGLSGGQSVMTINLSSLARDDGQSEIMLNMGMIDNSAMKSHALISADGKTGQAYGLEKGDHGDGPQEHTIQVAFDENHYLSKIDDTTKCLDRKNFNRNVWRYNLYKPDGSRKELNGGLGFKTTLKDTPNTQYGWASYWGIWADQRSHIEDGDQVFGNDGTPYTVRKAPGRLVKHTKLSAALADFINDPLQYWDQNLGQPVQVEWNGTEFMITGEFVCEPNSPCGFSDITPETMETTANQWLGFYKQGVGAVNVIVPDNNILSNETPVLYYQEIFVGLDATVPELKCYQNCLKAPLTGEEMNTGDVYKEPSNDVNAPYTYSFSSTTLTLTDENNEEVTLESGASVDANSPNAWGVNSGAMVPVSTSLENTWEIWNANVFYTWETGPNDWNKLSSLEKNGEAVKFDAPLQCRYVTNENKLYFIDYAGAGELHIPGVQISNDETGFSHWVPLFSIADGETLECNGKTYYVKAMSVEQSMQEVDSSECSDLSLGDISAPTNEFVDPDMSTAPIVTDPPAVIGGIVQ